MRQNSDVHEEVVAELLAWVGVHSDYMSLSEPERVELLAAELATRRPLTREHTHLSELARKELDILAAAARAVHVFGPHAVPNYIISMCRSVSDMLEAAILLKEVGLLASHDVRGVESVDPPEAEPAGPPDRRHHRQRQGTERSARADHCPDSWRPIAGRAPS